MADWKSPEELQKDFGVFVKFMHALLGLYAWEFLLSLDFDWEFITGKKKFRWPLVFYFSGRYLLLFALIGIVIAFDTVIEVNCQALFTFNQLAGDAAVGLASINLSIRTMAVWSQNRAITVLLVVIILGHWSLILQGVLLTATWVPNTGCVITSTHNTVLAATFIYSMAFDLVVLLLNAYKLLGFGSSAAAEKLSLGRGVGASRLGKMIFADGLIFFFIAFLSNLVATIFMLINLNQIMSVIFNVPAAVASTIVASRAVRRLTNFTNQGPEVFAATSGHSAIHFRSTLATRGGLGVTSASSAMHQMQARTKHARVHSGGVHVQMETFTHAEEPSDSDIAYGYDAVKRQTVVLTPGLGSPHGSDTDIDGTREGDVEAKGGDVL